MSLLDFLLKPKSPVSKILLCLMFLTLSTFCIECYAQPTTIIVESDLPYTNQRRLYELVPHEISSLWDEGKRITSAAYTGNGWFVAMSNNSGYAKQNYYQYYYMPADWIKGKWSAGYRITSLTSDGDSFLVVMSTTSGYGYQSYNQAEWSSMAQWIKTNWNEGLQITDLCFGGGKWVVVMSKKSSKEFQGYLWASDTPQLKNKVQSEIWDKGYRVQMIEHGKDGYLVVYGQNGDSISMKSHKQAWYVNHHDISEYLNHYLSEKCYISYIGGGARGISVLEGGGENITRPLNNNVASNPDASVKTYTVNGVSFKMVAVEGGTFTMGATPEQGDDASDNEKPAHLVTLSSYHIGQTEVTRELWKAVMGNNSSDYDVNFPHTPVFKVSWDDCQIFIKKLNALTGCRFRLPTEAEWEYAARGGNRSRGYKYSGADMLYFYGVAWCYGNNGFGPRNVATKVSNELGLYDMSGNVLEWCQDWFGDYSSSPQTDPKGASSGDYRVARGGNYQCLARVCRVSTRYGIKPGAKRDDCGFRLAL